METKILKGHPVSSAYIKSLNEEIAKLRKKNIIPGLAAILVGDNPASKVYIKSKERVFKKNNCLTKTFLLDGDSKEQDVINIVKSINSDPLYHGILIQLPLPKHINARSILLEIDPKKDVDGFHPINLGNLFEGNPQFIPCTPHGIIQILKYYNIPICGRHVVIVGRSNIVGKPMFALLAQNFEYGNATVTICHTRTKNLNTFTKKADIIVAAVGIPNLIKGDMVSPGVDIIDVGINRVEDKSSKGYYLTGDVDYNSVLGIANSITPVPGGVGPMTITMLLSNTIESAKKMLEY